MCQALPEKRKNNPRQRCNEVIQYRVIPNLLQNWIMDSETSSEWRKTQWSCWIYFSISSLLDSETSSEWRKSNGHAEFISASLLHWIPKQVRNNEKATVMLNSFQHLFFIGFLNKFGMTKNPMVMLNSFQHLFRIYSSLCSVTTKKDLV